MCLDLAGILASPNPTASGPGSITSPTTLNRALCYSFPLSWSGSEPAASLPDHPSITSFPESFDRDCARRLGSLKER